jgi:hypothetical protein
LELKLKRVHSLGPWSLAMTLKSERIARLIEQRSSPRELAPLRDLVDTMVLRLRTTFWRSPVGIPSRLKPETLFLGVSAFWLANCDDLANLRKVNGRHSEAVPAVFSGAPQLRAPKWYLALTTHLLPERLRGEFGLVFGEREQRSMNLALALIRRLYPRLPCAYGRWALSGGLGALARREAARLGSALAQQALDRPADDGIKLRNGS